MKKEEMRGVGCERKRERGGPTERERDSLFQRNKRKQTRQSYWRGAVIQLHVWQKTEGFDLPIAEGQY